MSQVYLEQVLGNFNKLISSFLKSTRSRFKPKQIYCRNHENSNDTSFLQGSRDSNLTFSSKNLQGKSLEKLFTPEVA